MLKKIFLTFLFYVFLVSKSYAMDVNIHIAILDSSPKLHLFFHELLETALNEDGHNTKLIKKKLSHLRLQNYFDSGKISINWLIESEDRNEKYIPIKVGLTNGLIGKRILLIKKGNQYLFDNVKNLSDFRKLDLKAAMGENWFDIKVWENNKLRYKVHSGNWKYIFRVLALQNRYDYFSRGLNEIIVESYEHPKLEIEKRLVLIYDRDFIFYLSKEGPNAGMKYKYIIEQALKKAKERGLINRLVEKYWAKDFKELNYENRIKLYLKTNFNK